MEEKDLTPVRYLVTAYFSIRFIYLVNFFTLLMTFLTGYIFMTPVITACGAGAFLLEVYLVSLLNKYNFDINDYVEDDEGDL